MKALVCQKCSVCLPEHFAHKCKLVLDKKYNGKNLKKYGKFNYFSSSVVSASLELISHCCCVALYKKNDTIFNEEPTQSATFAHRKHLPECNRNGTAIENDRSMRYDVQRSLCKPFSNIFQARKMAEMCHMNLITSIT